MTTSLYFFLIITANLMNMANFISLRGFHGNKISVFSTAVKLTYLPKQQMEDYRYVSDFFVGYNPSHLVKKPN